MLIDFQLSPDSLNRVLRTAPHLRPAPQLSVAGFHRARRDDHAVHVSASSTVLRLCYALSMASSTSSFRISEELRLRLEDAVRRAGKRKNWIINRALEEYLDRQSRSELQKEARRQSLLASRKGWTDEALWEKAAIEVWNDEV
jgi:predicted DNA-binding protein